MAQFDTGLIAGIREAARQVKGVSRRNLFAWAPQNLRRRQSASGRDNLWLESKSGRSWPERVGSYFARERHARR